MTGVADIFQYWSSDLQPNNIGDLLPVTGTIRGQQRILRRLLTNPGGLNSSGDYVFHPTYGAGLPAMIGKAIDIGKVTALIRGQLLLEDVVAKTPTPQVTVIQSASDFTAFNVSIRYNDSTTQQQTVLAFSVSA